MGEPAKVDLIDGAKGPSDALPSRLRVLLIEDDPVDAKMITWLAAKIDRFKLDITVAESVDLARSAYLEKEFDLFICDYFLGAETSVPLITEFTTSERRKPCIIISGLDKEDIQRIGMRAGAVCFLPKSDISSETLEATLASVLRMKAVEDRLFHDAESARGEKVAAIRRVSDWLKTVLNRVDRIHTAASLMTAKTEGTGNSELADMARHMIEDSASVRSELFERILRMERLDPDEQKHLATQIDLVAVLASSVELLRYDAERRRQRLYFSRPVTPVWIEYDPYLTTDAFENIVRHSVNVSPVGSEIDVRLTVEGGEALVVVQSSPPKSAGAVGRAGPDYDTEMSVNDLRLEPGQTFGLVAAAMIFDEHGGKLTVEQQSTGGEIVRARLDAQVTTAAAS